MKHGVVFLLALCSAFAQEFRSTLSGRVLDPSGAAIPGAKVTAVSAETGARSEAGAGADGEYAIPFLAPGAYRLEADSQGFKAFKQTGIQIGTNTRVTVDIKMEVGSQSESVTVTSDATLLTTATSSVGQVISSGQIENMPMNGRTPLTLAQLAYGVVPTSDPRFTRPFDNAGPSGFSMGGGQGQSNELLIDGSPDMTRNRRVAYNPPVDAVSEVKVEAFMPDAAYGNTAGGTVNVVMKGGTNEFHGSAYNFHQNSALKATPFFTNAARQVKPVTRFNQYGVSGGGPVWIPKVFNGRNRVFFFFSYEGIRQSEPEPTFSAVPTAAQRRGDFSALLAVGGQYQIFDPTSGVLEGARIRRQPIPDNVIPPSRISPISTRVMEFYPQPNFAGTVDGRNNYFNNQIRSDTFFGYMGRLDFNISDRHKLFWNIRTNDRVENRGNRFDNIATGNFLSRVNWGSTIDDVYTITPTLLVNTRLSWTRFTEGSIRPSDGYNFTQLGLPASLLAASTKNVFPVFRFESPGTSESFRQLGDSGGDKTPFDTYQIFSTVTKIAGRHTMKFGADLRKQVESSNSFGNSSGRYEFNSLWARGPLDTSPEAPIGQELTAFLLGFPTSGNFQVNATRTQQAYYYAFFVQDDFRLRNNLTLNIGIRYERDLGTTERYNRSLSGFDSAATNAVTAAARAAYAASPSPLLAAAQFNPLGGVTFANADNPKVYRTYPYAIAPRLGFSWSPAFLGGKTVLRGGVGLFYQGIGTTGIQQPGFSQQTALAANINNFLSPVATLANPFPGGIQQPVGAANGVNTFLGQNITFTQNQIGQPRTWRWNFNIQRELNANTVVEVGYIGSRAGHLPENRDLNFIPLSLLSTTGARDQANIDRLTAVIPNPFRGLLPGTGINGNTISTEQVLRPYPQFSGQAGVRGEGQTVGYSDFHMLQARVEKRFSQGLQFLANFQWSKMLEATNRLNVADPKLQYRIANEDRPLRLVFSGSYDLPFGKGKKFAGNIGPWSNRLIGGWKVNAIYTVQPGGPVDWGNVIYFGGDLNWQPRNLDSVFDTTRFNRVAAQQLDRNLRTFSQAFSRYRADGVNNIDLSLFKDTAITERVIIQLRCEAFNAFNRTQFNGPELSPTNTNFGRVTSAANLPRTYQLALRLKW
jgi:hypothetical protein